MPALHGRLLAESVLRPFAEHLAAMVQARPGEVCVDASGDGGVMPALLGRAAGDRGLCLAVNADSDVLSDVADEAALLRLDHTVRPVRAHLAALPLPTGSAQVATSLFALAHHADPAAALQELLRVLDPEHGRIACAAWSEPDASPHEGALLAALREATGRVPDALARGLLLGFPNAAEQLLVRAGGGASAQVLRIHDVVRFDGLGHYWAAMVSERPLAGEVAALPEDMAAGVRDALARRLAPYTAADGTMRIPTEAVVIVRA